VSDGFDIDGVNAGAGAKYIIKNAVALRAELNYRNHSWTEESSNVFYQVPKSEYSYSNIGMLFGFSVLL
jgi:hypothetical protein